VGELIVGIPDGDLRKDLGGKLAAIQPDVSFETVPRGIPIPSRQGRVVFIAQIPLSPRRPHIYEGYFYRRGAGGAAEHMNVYEVREQMLNTEERLRKLTLLRLEILQFLLMAREFRVSSRKVWEEGRRAMAAH
jgi:hypothetical protein